MSPQRPAYQQDALSASMQSIKPAPFNIHESPAMGLIRPDTSHTTRSGNCLADFKVFAHSLSHSSSSENVKPPILQENHHPRAEATFLTMASHHARSVDSDAGGLASPTGTENVHTGSLTHNDYAALRENPLLGSPFLRCPGPASAAFTQKMAPAAPSSFIQSLKQPESAKKVSLALRA